jgi:Holliday junction resolvase RusA-like endonuclease
MPKGSVTFMKGKYLPAGSAKTRKLAYSWANSVYEAAKEAKREVLDGPLFFSVEVWFDAPKSGKASKRTYHDVRPDLDKLIRAIWDPMTKAGLIHDDARICRIVSAVKRTIHDGSKPRAKIGVGRLWDGE